jgi:hypothetical protein
MIKCEWEFLLQHFAMAKRLSTVPDGLFHEVYDCEQEMAICIQELSAMCGPTTQLEGHTARQLRNLMRENAFAKWSAQSWQGVGVQHFKEYPKANAFVYDKNTLSGSEWTAAIKLSTGYANLLGVPGVVQNIAQTSNLCRRCTTATRREKETPGHVLGACGFNNERRIQRHNKVKESLATLLRAKGFRCVVEPYCKDGDGANRFVDILAYQPNSDVVYIIDPTVRWEDNHDVGKKVQEEKEEIYKSCYDDLCEKYPVILNRRCEVIGLWMGARGTVSTQMVDFFDRFHLDKKVLPELAETVLSDSIRMIHFHIYG